MKIDYQKLLQREKALIIKNDRLIYQIEIYNRMDVILKYVKDNGMRYITPMDFETIESLKR
ncbi:MAG: hypothetical protein SVZ03_12145 [Spirochaetota bacterium]|nr:hypothetical protein [Spirochaetota bacterium]